MKKRRSVRGIVIGSVIICLAVLAISFVAGHNIGFTSGCNEGHDAGYTEGHDNGYQLGHSEGYTIGYEDGYDDGLNEGYPLGHSEGYAVGYENGYDNGLDTGRTHGYNIWDPTYSEMRGFIARDRTDENEYIPIVYECKHFVADVCRNADKENIRCAFVILFFPEGGHACVAFNTIDRGLIFIEPMTDEEVDIEIGQPYWSREKYSPPNYDDTIEDIIVIW